jgi:hypothetical protein
MEFTWFDLGEVLCKNLVPEPHRVATASVIENWIDETERRTWFLREVLGDF